MKLIISQFDGNSPSAYLKWFLSTSDFSRIEKMKKPVIVISICHGYDNCQWFFTSAIEESRIACPLENGGCFISFRNSGMTDIYAEIVESQYPYFGNDHIVSFLEIESKRAGYNIYAKESKLKHNNHYVRTDDNDYSALIKKSDIIIHGERFIFRLKKHLSVVIDPKLFAPKPRDYEFVNSWFNKPAETNCQIRRRRLFAYSCTILYFCLFLITLQPLD